MRCIVHIINLIMIDGLKDINDIIAIVKVTERYVRQFPSKLTKFKECVVSIGVDSKCLLCLDVCIRWNFTFFMFVTIVKFERVFASFEYCDNSYKSELVRNGDGCPMIKIR